MIYGKHYSVMLPECLQAIEDNLDTTQTLYGVDGTFGGGGHTFAFLEKFTKLKMISFDQDPQAIENGKNNIQLKGYQDRITLIHDNFENFSKHLGLNNLPPKIDFILMDLGVSSHHFDQADGGFSFRKEANLDMRMDRGAKFKLTAEDVVNDFEEVELADLIYKFGEERLSRQIARNIVEFRTQKRITKTSELEEIIFHSYPKKMRFERLHPATKTFQALRIFVNRELEVLENALALAYERLNTPGLLMVISFHSLEDRIVKHYMKNVSQDDATGCKILTKKPIIATEQELSENSRSRSAKLRLLLKQLPHGGGNGSKKYYPKSAD